MTFTLKHLDDGQWEATADPCACHFGAHHTISQGLTVKHVSRQQAVDRLLGMYVQMMIEPLQAAGRLVAT